MSIIRITTPFTVENARALRAGDQVLLSGTVWTGRDAAHKKLVALLDAGKPLPMELKDQIIYFVGPCPAPPGRPIGSAGPTTSGRMDAYSPILIARCIKSCEVIAFPELGTEAVHRLTVEDFPLVVAIDAQGNSLYH